VFSQATAIMPPATQILRHRTALTRTALSRPVATALLEGIVNRTVTVFDYGCGRGDDVRYLQAEGITATGWDPSYTPDALKIPADVVNLGFVINVIEDVGERAACLNRAWDLANGVLVISARLIGDGDSASSTPFADGQVTTKRTFQKFYRQEELRSWIEQTIGMPAVPAGPGMFYVFREAARREEYLASRFRSRISRPRLRQSDKLFEIHSAQLATLIDFVSTRGRLPRDYEVENADDLCAAFGSIRRAFSIVRRVTGAEHWVMVTDKRAEDLMLYLALARFSGRPRWSALPDEVRLDIRAFFSNYRNACDKADALLLTAGRSEAVDRACRHAAVGKLTPSALYVHRSALDNLSPTLRVYEACGRALLGDVDDANVVKLSRTKPKISYLSYPAFDSDPHPALMRSIIARPDQLRISYRHYSDSPNPPILHRKEQFVATDYPLRAKFARLTASEERAGLFEDLATIGTRDGWQEALADRGLRIRGHRLLRPGGRSTARRIEEV
jgi:DNA phosphorothioation-associated putative methyltransferase